MRSSGESSAGTPGEPSKSIMMVSYNYPPVGTIGSLRVTKLARYLTSLGWNPTILTVSRDRTKWGRGDPAEGVLPGVRVVRAPFLDIVTALKEFLVKVGLLDQPSLPDEPGASGEIMAAGAGGGILRSAFRWAKRWVSFPDRYVLWVPSAVMRGLLELRRGEHEVIFSTSPPVTDHIVAAALHALTGLPWVADLRDPWVNAYLETSRFQVALDRLLERFILRRAAAIVTVSGPLAARMMEYHGERPGGVVCITNGYDPEEYVGEAEMDSDRFTITYTGAIFRLKQDPTTLMEVVEELISDGKVGADEIAVRFYGPRDPGLTELRDALEHPDIMEINGVVPRAEALSRQRESTALLVLLWDHPYTTLGYGGKVLEYLGARRPVLAWNPSGGVIEEMLDRTGAGNVAGDRAGLKVLLEGWLEEFKSTGKLAFKGKTDEIERYRWDRLAAEFAGLFERVYRRPIP